jgi:hypothetical protein
VQQFLDEHWPAMRRAAENGGGAAVVEMIEAFDDPVMRHLLYSTARQGLVFREWEGKNFDAYITVCDAGISRILAEAQGATGQARVDLYRGAHALGYNLTADLADCWPGDDAPRSRAHHQRGLRAAEEGLEWLQHLPSPAFDPHSRDHWARGIHQLALGDLSAAIESWTRSLEYAVRGARAAGQSTSIDGSGNFAVVLATGYLGLGRWIAGDAAGEALYRLAIAAFRDQLQDSERKNAAEIGIGQLEKVKSKHESPGPAELTGPTGTADPAGNVADGEFTLEAARSALAAVRDMAPGGLAAPLSPDDLAVVLAAGIEVKGFDQGLLDFPTRIEGVAAYWCWRSGEAEIDWWHPRDEGFADRRRIDE